MSTRSITRRRDEAWDIEFPLHKNRPVADDQAPP